MTTNRTAVTTRRANGQVIIWIYPNHLVDVVVARETANGARVTTMPHI